MGSTLAEINSDDENIHLAAKIYYMQQGRLMFDTYHGLKMIDFKF